MKRPSVSIVIFVVRSAIDSLRKFRRSGTASNERILHKAGAVSPQSAPQSFSKSLNDDFDIVESATWQMRGCTCAHTAAATLW
jgi:hypothetical protein